MVVLRTSNETTSIKGKNTAAEWLKPLPHQKNMVASRISNESTRTRGKKHTEKKMSTGTPLRKDLKTEQRKRTNADATMPRQYSTLDNGNVNWKSDRRSEGRGGGGIGLSVLDTHCTRRLRQFNSRRQGSKRCHVSSLVLMEVGDVLMILHVVVRPLTFAREWEGGGRGRWNIVRAVNKCMGPFSSIL